MRIGDIITSINLKEPEIRDLYKYNTYDGKRIYFVIIDIERMGKIMKYKYKLITGMLDRDYFFEDSIIHRNSDFVRRLSKEEYMLELL